jgi:hypothetical protein
MQFLRSFVESLAGSKSRLREVGFWAESTDDPLGVAKLLIHQGRPHPGLLIDRFWPSPERERVIAYLKAGRVRESYFGSSWCRLCGLTDLGSKDLTDGAWLWPEGFVHYLELHAVKPPQEFIDHVLRKVR